MSAQTTPLLRLVGSSRRRAEALDTFHEVGGIGTRNRWVPNIRYCPLSARVLDKFVGKRFSRPATNALPDGRNWQWRLRMVQRIAAELDATRFGVKALYLFGSVKNATSGPGSDIDLLIHDEGHERKRRELAEWLEGWSRSLAVTNYLRTGYKCDGLLDLHYVTDDDIRNKTSFAAKIGAVTDAARPLRIFSE